eukprot:CAMPEP_0175910008 /NCGR_PEP_ID=MMETSP0108-20121206/7432_1 /TAXON_ID=195067 ORGANISM="Goniomonas pacifica, Strain CCMP1869" /NCGR_SAMPLE_ID=MMETSP0108 /ASSEMBLY_ACC=CAM_ASM_000204 /LENGTH=128 /DNA_ID=CAMNT_0017232161 /DNA_START=15 /DNA_END=401 /DNA_ORIENTATION=+
MGTIETKISRSSKRKPLAAINAQDLSRSENKGGCPPEEEVPSFSVSSIELDLSAASSQGGVALDPAATKALAAIYADKPKPRRTIPKKAQRGAADDALKEKGKRELDDLRAMIAAAAAEELVCEVADP